MDQTPPDRTALLKTIEQTYDPSRHQVLLIADANHYRAIETVKLTLQAAQELKTKGITSVALEFLPMHDQRLYDALYAKEISRESFLDIVRLHSNSGQMTAQEHTQLYHMLADTIENGTRVYGINTRMYAPSDVPLDKKIEDYMGLFMARTVDQKIFEETHQTELQNSPEALFMRLKQNSAI